MKFELKQRLIFLAAAALAVFGCTMHSSNNPFTTNTTNASALAAYFPATKGWTSVFGVSSGGSSSTLTFYVNDDISLHGENAHRLIIISSQGTSDTNYVVVGPTELLVYQDGLSSAEHILQLPLNLGSSWLRFPDQPLATMDTTSILTDLGGGKFDTTSSGPGADGRKLLPIDGNNQLTVMSIEELVTAAGEHFSAAVRISNTDRSGDSNTYWYVAGIGLVKYILGANDQNPSGRTVGEILEYGLR